MHMYAPDCLTQAEDDHAERLERKAVPDAPGSDETPQEFLARISNPPTPSLDKLTTFAQHWREVEEAEAALERRRLADQDAYWDRVADRDGDEVAA